MRRSPSIRRTTACGAGEVARAPRPRTCTRRRGPGPEEHQRGASTPDGHLEDARLRVAATLSGGGLRADDDDMMNGSETDGVAGTHALHGARGPASHPYRRRRRTLSDHGVVLHEIITGRFPFERATPSEVVAPQFCAGLLPLLLPPGAAAGNSRLLIARASHLVFVPATPARR